MIPYELPIFISVSALTVCASYAVLAEKQIFRSVIALTLAFTGSSLLFMFLDQTFVAFLQLFIFVGGLSTYLIVAIAAEETKKKPISIAYFTVLALLLSAGLSAIAVRSGPASVHGSSFLGAASAAISSYYPMLYAFALLLFACTLGSVIVLRKHIRLIV
jgi:NADH:ubiquinone oxidoreductase subunit 6 (subunit J)